MLFRVEHVPSEHVLASVAARGLRDLCRKFVAFLGARCGRIHREGIDRNFETKAARRRGVTGADLTVHAADDDVVVAEARERAVAVDEEADFGRLRIDAVARRSGRNIHLRPHRLGEHRRLPGRRQRLACRGKQHRE